MDFSVQRPGAPDTNVVPVAGSASRPVEAAGIQPRQEADHLLQHGKAVAHGIPTTAAAASQYQRAVARIEGQLRDEVVLQAVGTSGGLKLRDNYASIFMSRPGARGTVVMFHGYTAGPWQYKEMAEQFHKAGYNVYVPRLPGHGLINAKGMGTGAEIPGSTQRDAYERFIDDVYKDTAALGAPVYVVGLSGGGDLALRSAEKYPAIKGCVAMSPYLGPNGAGRLAINALLTLDQLTFGAVGRILDHIPYNKNTLNQPGDPTPHTEGSFGQALAMLAVGRSVRQVQIPVQFFTTDGDFLAGSKPVGTLYQHNGGASRDGWVVFPKAEHVPHAMLSKLENKAPGVVDQLNAMVFQFIDQGKEFSSPPGAH